MVYSLLPTDDELFIVESSGVSFDSRHDLLFPSRFAQNQVSIDCVASLLVALLFAVSYWRPCFVSTLRLSLLDIYFMSFFHGFSWVKAPFLFPAKSGKRGISYSWWLQHKKKQKKTSECLDTLQQTVWECLFITRADGSSQLLLAFTLSATIFIEQPRDTSNDTWSGTLGKREGDAEFRNAALSISHFL